jgi:hypothetical protein
MITDMPNGTIQSHPTADYANECQQSGGGGPQSTESQAVNRVGGRLGNVRRHQNNMNQTHE